MNNELKYKCGLEIDHHENKRWYLNGKLHREDGPAIILSSGTKVWCLNGKRHRIDGPAYIHPDGTKEWWLNDEYYSYDEWFNKLNPEQQINSLWNLDEEHFDF